MKLNAESWNMCMSMNKSRWFDRLQVLLWLWEQERLLFKASHTGGVLTENHFKSSKHPKVKSRAAANKPHLLFQKDSLKALFNNVFPCHRVDRYHINGVSSTTTLKRFDLQAANPHIGDALITILPFFSQQINSLFQQYCNVHYDESAQTRHGREPMWVFKACIPTK